MDANYIEVDNEGKVSLYDASRFKTKYKHLKFFRVVKKDGEFVNNKLGALSVH